MTITYGGTRVLRLYGAYRKALYCTVVLLIVLIIYNQRLNERIPRYFITPMREEPTEAANTLSWNANIYYNRYCIRRQLPDTSYGYASVIRQMRWIINTSETAIEEEAPLIFYDKRFLYHGLSSHGCQYRCRFSTEYADYRQAVLAVFTDNPPAEALPKFDNQTWAMESGESPFHMRQISAHLRQHFKIFLTTNGESHVPWVYAVFMANERPETVVSQHKQVIMLNDENTQWLPEQHAQRKKKVAALLSNLYSKNKRIEYINELSKYIDVDFYGRGRLPCARERPVCLQNLSLQYKFYLAFENSNCHYYITEKLFTNALHFGMIPIVMGAPREDYCKLAPPNSFIHVDDFSSPAELAEYLNWLDRNDTAYASYFAWKAYGNIVTETKIQCRLCGFLHQNLNGLASVPTKGFDYFTNPTRQCTLS